MRKSKTVVISDGSRDDGRHYIITEMSAADAERIAIKAMLALGHAGIDVPDYTKGMGVEGLVILGIQAMMKVRYDDIAPLLDESFVKCVAFIPDPSKPDIIRGAHPSAIGKMIDDDIEEVSTRFKLRAEVFELHTGFSLAAAKSISQA